MSIHHVIPLSPLSHLRQQTHLTASPSTSSQCIKSTQPPAVPDVPPSSQCSDAAQRTQSTTMLEKKNQKQQPILSIPSKDPPGTLSAATSARQSPSCRSPGRPSSALHLPWRVRARRFRSSAPWRTSRCARRRARPVDLGVAGAGGRGSAKRW